MYSGLNGIILLILALKAAFPARSQNGKKSTKNGLTNNNLKTDSYKVSTEVSVPSKSMANTGLEFR